jgi:hypothetical protein
MNYIIEALLVGIYTVIIYLFFSLFIKNLYGLLLVVGFFKHLLGYYINIHSWYCNNGEACVKVLNHDYIYQASSLHLIRDSLYDSFVFLIIGFILYYKLTNVNKYALFFTIGVLLHIMSEHLLVHKYFCKTTCNNN